MRAVVRRGLGVSDSQHTSPRSVQGMGGGSCPVRCLECVTDCRIWSRNNHALGVPKLLRHAERFCWAPGQTASPFLLTISRIGAASDTFPAIADPRRTYRRPQ